MHTNAPLHRLAALRALGLNARDTELSREQIAAAVQTTQASALEQEIIQQPARRLLPAYQLAGTTAYWSLPAGRLGDGNPVFHSD